MSGHIPYTSEPDPSTLPPPYSVAVESDAQDKTSAYPSAPAWVYPPPGADLPQVVHGQVGEYPMQPGFFAHPLFSRPGTYPPSSPYGPQQPGPYCAQMPSGYGTAYTQQPGAYSTSPQQATVVVQQPLLASVVQPFREFPVQTVCPKCQATVMTVTVYEVGTLSWLLCAILCLIGCDGGCCLIPLICANSCKDVVHVCPNCHQAISRFNRL